MKPKETYDPAVQPFVPPSDLSTRELVAAVTGTATELVKKEVELARIELKQDLKAQITSAIWLGIAAVGALMVLAMLLVTAVFGFANVVAGWGAALIVAGIVAGPTALAALIGWLKLVKTPLETTRKTLKEDLEWAKQRLA